MRIPRLKLGLVFLVASAVVAAAGAAGVAVGSSSPASGLPVTLAFAKTVGVLEGSSGEFGVTFTLTGRGPSIPGGHISVNASGGFDSKHHATRFQLDLGSLAGLASLSGAQIPNTIETVTLNTFAYAHLPSVADAVAPGKQWLKFDLGSLLTTAVGGAAPTSLGLAQAAAILAAVGPAKSLGSLTIRGSVTTHDRVEVDVQKVARGLLSKSQQAAAVALLRQAGLKSLPVDVYVDHSGYVRRLMIAIANLKTKGRPPVSIRLTVDLYDFGTAVHAVKPPARKTADGSAFVAQVLEGLLRR
jgi:pyruvoyl-dependent arginine decarboxylase (PvlArgDC)